MAKAKKKFDEDFKKIILDLNQSGQSVEELAEQYGIATQTIYRWKKLYTKNEATGMTEAEILGCCCLKVSLSMTITSPCVSSKIADRKLVFPDPGCPPSKKAVGDSTAFFP